MGHQMRNATTMTVVICIMRSALPLDSWIPLILLPPEIESDDHREEGGEECWDRDARPECATSSIR